MRAVPCGLERMSATFARQAYRAEFLGFGGGEVVGDPPGGVGAGVVGDDDLPVQAPVLRHGSLRGEAGVVAQPAGEPGVVASLLLLVISGQNDVDVRLARDADRRCRLLEVLRRDGCVECGSRMCAVNGLVGDGGVAFCLVCGDGVCRGERCGCCERCWCGGHDDPFVFPVFPGILESIMAGESAGRCRDSSIPRAEERRDCGESSGRTLGERENGKRERKWLPQIIRRRSCMRGERSSADYVVGVMQFIQ